MSKAQPTANDPIGAQHIGGIEVSTTEENDGKATFYKVEQDDVDYRLHITGGQEYDVVWIDDYRWNMTRTRINDELENVYLYHDDMVIGSFDFDQFPRNFIDVLRNY